MKLFLIFSICLLSLPVASQPLHKTSIEERKRRLTFLQDDERLECLTNIAFQYFYSSNVQSDSALKYARQAVGEAKNSTNKRKAFRAADIYAKVLLQFSKADEGLHYYREALKLARALDNDTLKAVAFRGVGQALSYQGNFQRSIDTIKLSIIYYQRINDIRAVSDAKMVISNIYGDMGNYEEAFEASLEALRLSKNLGDEDNTVLSLTQLGDLYRNIGDYQTALEYYRSGFSYDPDNKSWSYRHLSNCTGDLYCKLEKFDSAYMFYRQGLVGHPASKTSRLRLGEYYLLRKHYDTALIYFRGLYDELKTSGEGNILIYAMLGMGKIFYAKGDYSQAMNFGKQALELGEVKGTKQIIRDASKLLSNIYEKLKHTDNAFFHYKKYVQIKDSIITDQFKGRLYAFRQASQSEKEQKQIESLQKQRILTMRVTKVLVAAVLLLCLITIILVGNLKLRRKNQKLQTERMEAEWQRRASELEMQALRAQMNPHFIFNCLSSINKFILKNDPDNASDYLTRFSRLIRLVLLNSQKPLIVLEDELEMLRLYIEMEKLRFKNTFDYTITYTDDIDPSHIFIPPLMLQPFCENAIWHGLMHKEGMGKLDIFFQMQNKMIVCTITDNGIGREKASEIKTKSAERIKSLGLKLTAERLALFNEGKSVRTFYKMEDVIERGIVSGTRVMVNIKYREGIEEPV